MNNIVSKKAYFFILLIILTILHLLLKISNELDKDFSPSFNNIMYQENNLFNTLKTEKSIGWFNLEEYENYEKGADFKYICFQYLIAPTLLENLAYDKKIICYYTSPASLASFCKKNKKYRLIRKNILTNFALLEKYK